MTGVSGTREGEDTDSLIEVVTRWGLVLLAVIAATGGLLRILSPPTIDVAHGLDQVTLLYLNVAGALLPTGRFNADIGRGAAIGHGCRPTSDSDLSRLFQPAPGQICSSLNEGQLFKAAKATTPLPPSASPSKTVKYPFISGSPRITRPS
jgi:hypothetical protein